MKRITVILAAMLSLVVFTSLASAHTPRATRGQARQHARIHEGVRRGDLTGREAARLRAGQARIRHMHRLAWRDGFVSHRERATIRRAQAREFRMIHRLRHNARYQ